MTDVFAGLQGNPFWWDEAPRRKLVPDSIPPAVDTLVIGSGFSGLATARVLANGGRTVLVCDSGSPGIGASTRNGGMLGPSFHKLGGKGLVANYGRERAWAILSESVGFVEFIRGLITEESIDCEFRQVGRFRAASKPAHFDAMQRELEEQIEATGIDADIVPRDRVAEELGSDRFFGGVRYRIDGCLHPGKYHDGLLAAVERAGAVVAGETEVSAIARTPSGYLVTTTRGDVQAAQIAVCTNAYTGKVTPWFRRRILPIRSSMIATEPLPADLMRKLMPTGRCYGDSRRVMAYYRPSPDGRRILFGGRATGADRPLENARALRRSMLDVFPELNDIGITHSWSGLVGYAFDHVPHLGRHDGIFYAMGYCGSGVARASYFGTRLGYKMLGDEERGRTAFDDLPFRSRPLYTGNPWFMPPLIGWHRLLDRFGL